MLTCCVPGYALEVGFAVVDVTPEISGDAPVWLAGYGQNRRATGVHDPLYARAIVLRDGDQKVALVVADVVGLFLPTTQEIRSRLEGFDYVMVAATHNHEGPDTMGLWGPSPFRSGVDPAYMELLIERCAQAVRQADAMAVGSTAAYGVAQDDVLLRDTRQPIVYDGVLRVVRFTSTTDQANVGLLVQWNCHPEAMGSNNTEITADGSYATVARVEGKDRCPAVIVSAPWVA